MTRLGRKRFSAISAPFSALRTTEERLDSKLRLVRSLYDRGLSRQELRQLFHCIDWFMDLCPHNTLTEQFHDEMVQFEEARKMRHITTIEKLGRRKGREHGLIEGVLTVLESRFGPLPDGLRDDVLRVRDEQAILELLQSASTDSSLEEFSRRLHDS